MAIYSLSAGVFSRSKGHHVTAAAGYRAGEKIRDTTIGATFDYSRKHGIAHSEIIAPEGAPAWMHDRQQLWNAVEAQEKRCDAQLAREILVALPHELDETERLELVRGFVRAEFVAAGMVADFSIHEPSRDGDDRNHHCHIMLSLRRAGPEGFSLKKAREWNSDTQLEQWREAWAGHVNDALSDAGFDARVSHLTLEAQGLDREPGIHVGKHGTALESQGIASTRAGENRETSERNTEIDRLVAELAALDDEIAREQRERIFGSGFDAFAVQEPELDPRAPEAWPELAADAPAEEAQVEIAAAPFAADIESQGEVREIDTGTSWWQRGAEAMSRVIDQARGFARDTWQWFVDRGREEPERDRDIGPDMG